MTVQGGFGLTCRITINSTLTAITHILDADLPEQLKEMAEKTAHDSPSGYREYVDTGLRELTEFTLTLAWDDTEATHAALKAAFDGTEAVNFNIQDPLGQEVIAFAAFVRRIGRVSKMPDAYKATVSIRPTGAPTIT